MRIPRLVLAAAAAAVVAVPAFAEDLTVVFKTTGAGKVGTSTAYYSAERMRTSDGTSDTIIEYGPGRIVTIDHKRKEYSEITMAEMDAALAKMAAQMQEQMAAMPPAMRQMMGGGAASVTVTKGAVRKVAGYDCQDYTLALGTSNTMHVCASTAVAPPAAKVDYRKYASLAGMANSPMFKSFAKLADEMKKIQGFTLADVLVDEDDGPEHPVLARGHRGEEGRDRRLRLRRRRDRAGLQEGAAPADQDEVGRDVHPLVDTAWLAREQRSWAARRRRALVPGPRPQGP